MKDSRHYWMGSVALLLIGCNSVDLGFVPLCAVRPEAEIDMMTGALTCQYDPTGESMPFVSINVAQQAAFSLIIAIENNMQQIEIETQATGFAQNISVPSSIQPLRFDFRWECDSTGFTAGQGPLRLPAFGADRPFSARFS